MIEERYCSYEVSKLLKEKGFDEVISTYYDDATIFCHGSKFKWNRSPMGQTAAPTHQMAIAWLREKGIYITIIYGDYPVYKKIFWTPQIDSLEGFDLPDSFYQEYDSYEEAVEAALKYALENLI